MNAVALTAIYIVVWWIVLFAVLPFGVRTQSDDGDVVLGSAHSAPTRLRLVPKALATTIIAALVVFLIWLAIDVYGYDLEWLADTFDVT